MSKGQVFESEVEAAMYPLPVFTNKMVKLLIDSNDTKILPSILNDALSVLLGLGLAKIYKDQKSANQQVKYFTTVARLLNIVRIDLQQSNDPERSLKWAPYI